MAVHGGDRAAGRAGAVLEFDDVPAPRRRCSRSSSPSRSCRWKRAGKGGRPAMALKSSARRRRGTDRSIDEAASAGRVVSPHFVTLPGAAPVSGRIVLVVADRQRVGGAVGRHLRLLGVVVELGAVVEEQDLDRDDRARLVEVDAQGLADVDLAARRAAVDAEPGAPLFDFFVSVLPGRDVAPSTAQLAEPEQSRRLQRVRVDRERCLRSASPAAAKPSRPAAARPRASLNVATCASPYVLYAVVPRRTIPARWPCA